jgi:hypothetical protein
MFSYDRSRRYSPILLLGYYLATFLAITATPLVSAGQTAWINEFHYDNDGVDTQEFVEVVIQRSESYDIGDFSVHLVNGSDGGIYKTVTGNALNEGQTYGLFTIYTWVSAELQNGDDGIALTYNGQLLQFISYEGSFAGTEAPVLDVSSANLAVEESPSTPAEHSLQLIGSGNAYTSFEWTGPAPASPGTINTDQQFEGIPLRVIPVPETLSPGDTVAVEFILGHSEFPVANVTGAGFQMSVDTSLFDILDLTAGSFLTTDTLTFRRIDRTKGHVAYSVTTTDTTAAQSATGILATSRLQVTSSPIADTTLTVSVEDLLMTQTSGVTVTPVADVQPLTIQSSPVLQLSDTTLDIGLADISTTAADTFVVRNAGGSTLEVTEISAALTNFNSEPSSFTVAPGESQQIIISFKPPADSVFAEILTIISNDSEHPAYEVTVEGETGAVVWPGDTDNNGTVNALDLLPIGQHFGRSGPARNPVDISWDGVQVLPWSPIPATYADATGDGQVTQNDLQPIGYNYNRQRSLGKLSRAAAPGRSITIEPVTAGTVFPIVIAAPPDHPVSEMLGIGIGLTFSPDRFEVVEVNHHLTVDTHDLLAFEHIDSRSGLVDVAYTRKRAAGGIIGSGSLVSVRFRARRSIQETSSITLNRVATSSVETVNLTPDVSLESDASMAGEHPSQFKLRGNYPNPFNSSTTILLDVPTSATVSVVVYDILGRAVIRLPTRRVHPGYNRQLVLRADRLSSGTYFYRITAASREPYTATGSFTLLK